MLSNILCQFFCMFSLPQLLLNFLKTILIKKKTKITTAPFVHFLEAEKHSLLMKDLEKYVSKEMTAVLLERERQKS